MGQVKLNSQAHSELEKIKIEIQGSGSQAISFLYKKYLFWKSEKRKGNTDTEVYE